MCKQPFLKEQFSFCVCLLAAGCNCVYKLHKNFQLEQHIFISLIIDKKHF